MEPHGGVADSVRRWTRQITEAPTGWPGVLVTLACVATVRTVLELFLDTEHTVLYHGGTYSDLLTYANAFVSWLVTALLLGLILKRFAALDSLRTGRLVCTLLAVSWIVPPINWISTGGKGANLYYGHDAKDLLFNLVHLFDPTTAIPMAPAGVRVEILLVTVACLAFAPMAFGIGRLRAVGLAFSVYGAVFALGYLPALYEGVLGVLPRRWRWEIETPVDFFLIYVPLLPILGAWLLRDLLREGSLPSGSARWLFYPSRLAFYLYLALFGFTHAAAQNGSLLAALGPRTMLQLASTVLSIVLLFSWARIINDVHDIEIDRVSNSRRPLAAKQLSPATAMHNSRILVSLSLLTIVPAGPTALPLWALVAALCYVYSSPPLRLRRFYPIGHGVLATLGASVFGLGASLVAKSGIYDLLTSGLLVPGLFAAFFFLSHMKDLKDVEGDQAGGVYNIFHSPRWRRGLAWLAMSGFIAAALVIMREVGLWQPAPIALAVVFLGASLAQLRRLGDLKQGERVFGWIMVLAALLSVLWLGRHLH